MAGVNRLTDGRIGGTNIGADRITSYVGTDTSSDGFTIGTDIGADSIAKLRSHVVADHLAYGIGHIHVSDQLANHDGSDNIGDRPTVVPDPGTNTTANPQPVTGAEPEPVAAADPEHVDPGTNTIADRQPQPDPSAQPEPNS